MYWFHYMSSEVDFISKRTFSACIIFFCVDINDCIGFTLTLTHNHSARNSHAATTIGGILGTDNCLQLTKSVQMLETAACLTFQSYQCNFISFQRLCCYVNTHCSKNLNNRKIKLCFQRYHDCSVFSFSSCQKQPVPHRSTKVGTTQLFLLPHPQFLTLLINFTHYFSHR